MGKSSSITQKAGTGDEMMPLVRAVVMRESHRCPGTVSVFCSRKLTLAVVGMLLHLRSAVSSIKWRLGKHLTRLSRSMCLTRCVWLLRNASDAHTCDVTSTHVRDVARNA